MLDRLLDMIFVCVHKLSQYSYILVSDDNQNINPYYEAYYSKSLFLSSFSPNYEMMSHIIWLLAGTLQNKRMPTNYSFKNLLQHLNNISTIQRTKLCKYSTDVVVVLNTHVCRIVSWPQFLAQVSATPPLSISFTTEE